MAVADTDVGLGIPAVAFYGFLKGPGLPAEIEALHRLVALDAILPFGKREAELAGILYHSVGRARARMVDLMIAATAIVHNAPLWTLNPRDFADTPSRSYTAFDASLPRIQPSASWITRWPYLAFSSECVTWTMVVPSSLSFLNSSMISLPWPECRLPVGSSARISFGFAITARATATSCC